MINIDNDFAAALPELCVPWAVADFPALLVGQFNTAYATELGLEAENLAAYVSSLSTATPGVAMAYAGHQFGHYSPQLGDGRALLLGEIKAADGTRHDIHLKGSGRTPFSRGGDGKAALAPMLREYLMSEAMAALGIPTTRSLAVLTTGESVLRETGPLPGAMLVRCAESHIRVGTFQYAAANGGIDMVRKLADYSISRHFPSCARAETPYAAFLNCVMDAQILLVAKWMAVGFVHGVMNSDNMAISGATIDYGPCAFIDTYAPDAVFSSIDTHGRYAFANQPNIAAWSLARLAECLLPLLGEGVTGIEAANAVLLQFADRYRAAWGAEIARKIGIYDPLISDDHTLIVDLFDAMAEQNVDYTLFFVALTNDINTGRDATPDMFDDPAKFLVWRTRWHARLAQNPMAKLGRVARMKTVNPEYIPRNHLVEAALADASARDDYTAFDRLLAVLRAPFSNKGSDWDVLTYPPPPSLPRHVTYCGT